MVPALGLSKGPCYITWLSLSLLFPQHFQEGRRAQQQLESGFKQLENVSLWERKVALVPGSRVRVAEPQSCPLCLARAPRLLAFPACLLPPICWVTFHQSLKSWLPLPSDVRDGCSFILVLSPTQSKRKFERDCREAEKAAQTAERLDQDINATKADVEKVLWDLGQPWGVRVGWSQNLSLTPSSIFLRPSNKPTFEVIWQKKAKMSMQPNCSVSTETRRTSIFPRCPRYLM